MVDAVQEAAKDEGLSEKDLYDRWMAECSSAEKDPRYKRWIKRAEKIVKRYRDEMSAAEDSGDAEEASASQFNILWSNVQTLQPALFAKPPKPVVERRYLDRDPVGRLASTIMERTLSYEIDSGQFDATIRRVVLDRLLPGRGVAWVRYEPTFRTMPSQATNPEADAKQPEEPAEEKVYECTGLDYIDYRDFLTAVCATWEANPWVRRRLRMSRDELVERFKEKGRRVPLNWSPFSPKDKGGAGTAEANEPTIGKKGIVYEFWHKPSRKVFWFSPDLKDVILDQKEDPLKLDGFFPTPRPLSATVTNDTMIPVPDYREYESQALELDNLTARITALTAAIKAAGVYDASVPQLQRMLAEDFENSLVPCDNWASFSEKMGSGGMGGIWMLPIKDMAAVLIQLYEARNQVKQVLYEITGISDIVRGQSAAGSPATATEQRLKGQFASLRLNEMQSEVARYVRDCLRIMGEIIAEHFSPDTLYLISGYEQYAVDQAQMGSAPGGGPAPGMGQQPQGAMQPPAMQPGMAPPQPDPKLQAKERFVEAIKLLREDRQRGFRIDIETKSMIEPDQQEAKKSVVELFGALSQFIPKAMELGQAQPSMAPLMGKMLLFGLRRFELGRDLESSFEQAVDDMEKTAQNPQPKPPSPEEVKAQAEIKKQEMETQRAQMDMANEQQRMQMEMQMLQQKSAMEMEMMQAKLQFEEQKLAMQERKMALDAQAAQQKHALDAQAQDRDAAMAEEQAQRDFALSERQAARDFEMGEREHERGLETMEVKHDTGLEIMAEKAKQAKAPKPNGAGAKK